VTLTRDHVDLLVLDCAEDSDTAGIRLTAEHQLVMSEKRTGRELVIGLHETRGHRALLAILDRRAAEALRDWISARLASGEIR
jgi:hypothetical protein